MSDDRALSGGPATSNVATRGTGGGVGEITVVELCHDPHCTGPRGCVPQAPKCHDTPPEPIGDSVCWSRQFQFDVGLPRPQEKTIKRGTRAVKVTVDQADHLYVRQELKHDVTWILRGCLGQGNKTVRFSVSWIEYFSVRRKSQNLGSTEVPDSQFQNAPWCVDACYLHTRAEAELRLVTLFPQDKRVPLPKYVARSVKLSKGAPTSYVPREKSGTMKDDTTFKSVFSVGESPFPSRPASYSYDNVVDHCAPLSPIKHLNYLGPDPAATPYAMILPRTGPMSAAVVAGWPPLWWSRGSREHAMWRLAAGVEQGSAEERRRPHGLDA